MTVKVGRLPNDHFARLEYFHDGAKPDAQSSIAVVAEQDGQIIGRIFLVAPVHIEGPYILPEHRGGMLLKQMVDVATEEAKKCGISKLIAHGEMPETEDYLERLGFTRMPVSVWAKEI